MHYIRLLRPPTVTIRDKGVTILHLCFTIATDLGDAYLVPPQPIALTLTYWVNNQLQKPTLPLCKWTAGTRVYKLDVPLKVFARGSYVSRIFISPADPALGLMQMQQLLTAETPLVVPVVAAVAAAGAGVGKVGEVELFTNRQVLLGDVQGKRVFLALSEAIQDSIARRVWDGGMVTAAVLYELAAAEQRTLPKAAAALGTVKEMMGRGELRVLELGCGVGTLGAAFASGVAHRYKGEKGWKSGHRIVMTDLADAEEIARRNIGLYNTGMNGLVAPALEYENLDWFDCKEEVMGPLVAQESRWDLIIISDCTYNTDVIPALVGSLDTLHRRGVEADGEGPVVLLSTKPRHDSESVFWTHMEGAGWEIREQAEFPIKNLGAADEKVEVYLFGKRRQGRA